MSIKTEGAEWNFGYCRNCDAIQPIRIDHMLAAGAADHDALDIICDVCHWIMVCLHERPDLAPAAGGGA